MLSAIRASSMTGHLLPIYKLLRWSLVLGQQHPQKRTQNLRYLLLKVSYDF
jgi:hypothetical protein